MNKHKISHLIFIFVFTSLSFSLSAQNKVNLIIADGLGNESLKSKAETAISNLLSEVNTAQSEKRSLNFASSDLTTLAGESLAMLWENVRFRCIDNEVVEICLHNASEYQVRNIPLMLMPEEDGVKEEYQEAVISFNKDGQITSFYLTLPKNMYANVMKNNLEVTDLRRRQLILDYVEQFRTAYNMRDINFLNQIFSDDALIITGNVAKSGMSDGRFTEPKVTYKAQGKKEYLQNLKDKVFNAKKYLKVTFSDIKVSRAQKENYYGVLLHQGWASGGYSDEGYVFLFWDFENEDAPQIHVRTWQPEYLDKAKTKKLPEEDIFSLLNFDL